MAPPAAPPKAPKVPTVLVTLPDGREVEVPKDLAGVRFISDSDKLKVDRIPVYRNRMVGGQLVADEKRPDMFEFVDGAYPAGRDLTHAEYAELVSHGLYPRKFALQTKAQADAIKRASGPGISLDDLSEDELEAALAARRALRAGDVLELDHAAEAGAADALEAMAAELEEARAELARLKAAEAAKVPPALRPAPVVDGDPDDGDPDDGDPDDGGDDDQVDDDQVDAHPEVQAGDLAAAVEILAARGVSVDVLLTRAGNPSPAKIRDAADSLVPPVTFPNL
jgi:hypothetical protein